jgi:predicted acyl esterase
MRPTAALSIVAALLLVPASADAALHIRGSAEQVYVTGAKRGAKVELLRGTKTVTTLRAGALGGVIFRGVKPGSYRVRAGARGIGAVKVLSNRSAPPSTKPYRQKIPADGYGYLTTRDGTRLAINVHLPSGDGPYPTLVEYSGYGYARPSGGESSIAQIANLLGYAVVDVNMRGTGCSGGAFDYFEPLQGLDGYDVVETVARQSWVARHKVGMMGISYGGISQLFVAATNPPNLVGITPLSVIDNTATTLYPGGILNTGFAFSWAEDRAHDAKPASADGGQAWALERIQKGDKVCKANQVLHAEAPDLIAKLRANDYYRAKVADPLSPVTFVHKIKAPVFLACQFTDEQTGGHCPTLAARFTSTTRKWFTFTNGTHIDSLDPATFVRWFDFLELYVAHRAPHLTDGQRALAGVVYKTAMGVDGVTLPDDPIQSQPDYDSALAAFEALPQVRVMLDNGAGVDGKPGMPVAGFEATFPSWPPPGTAARSFFLGAGGALADAAPAAAGGPESFTWDPAARAPTDFSGNTGSGENGLWTATPPYAWLAPPAGSGLSWTSAPLSADTVVIGAGALDLSLQAAAPDVDLQATVTEVRPDGKETLVQGGWLRASKRKLDAAKSTELEPVPSLKKADASPLPAGRFTALSIPLYYEGHAYRAGSRIRVYLTAPGGDQPVWSFAELQPATGTTTVTLDYPTTEPARLVLPVVAGVAVPTGLPPCPGLRGEPCR